MSENTVDTTGTLWQSAGKFLTQSQREKLDKEIEEAFYKALTWVVRDQSKLVQ